MPDYRLLVVDIDGTLVGRDGRIRPRVRAAIQAALAQGVRVALCTGRPLRACQPLVAALGLTGPQIAFDGALVSDSAGTTVVLRQPVANRALAALYAWARAVDLCLELYTEAGYYIDRPWPESRRHGALIGLPPVVADYGPLLASATLIKGQFVVADPARRALVEAYLATAPLDLRFAWAKPPPDLPGLDFVNITHPAVDKGTAVRALAAYYGLPLTAVMAVGDGPNDLPFLRVAGLAVAMGNACEAVKAAAHVVTAPLEEDGLALAVERFLLSRPVQTGRTG